MNYNTLLLQISKKPRVHGYVSPLTKTKLSPIHGLGLFAKQNIKKGVVVAVWGGRVTTKKEIESLPKDVGYNYALELYPGFYLAETSLSQLDSSDFINHSCDPNCDIISTFVMITKRSILKGQELTADFSNNKTKGQKFTCNCGAEKCRKTVYFD